MTTLPMSSTVRDAIHSLLIVVSVTTDTFAQIKGYLLAHQYEGLIKRSKLRGAAMINRQLRTP